jgi:transcriptional regulator with XRE-family HTH domain
MNCSQTGPMAHRHRPTTSDLTSMSFGARMRLERERRKISIATIAESTKILGALLEGLENDDVSRWPTGFYRRAFMRAYASAIGLDPEVTLKEFVERFPDPEDKSMISSEKPAVRQEASRTAPVRVATPPAGAWFSEGALVKGIGLRFFAAAVDLFVLSVMGLALYAVLGMFWAPMCLATAAYYSVSILLLGNTPGVCLFADPAKRGRVYLTFAALSEQLTALRADGR